MAIDTKAERAWVFGHARPWMRQVHPDATRGERWRRNVGHAYPGTAIATARASLCLEALDVYAPGTTEAELYEPGTDSLQVGCC